MSMADDNTFRSNRSNDPHRREPSRSSQSDPLAELARLIGQSDPFAELGRSNQRQDQQRAEQRTQAAPPAAARDWPAAPSYDQHYGSDDAWRRARDDSHDPNYGSQQGSHDANYGSHQGAPYQPTYASDHRSSQDYSHPLPPATETHAQDDRGYEGPHDDAHFAAGEHRRDDGVEGEQVESYYPDDAPLQPQEDAMYDDAPRARRRGGLVTALALIGCAMLGTAGAYAYRSYYGSPDSTQPPPVITADSSTPTKIVPATAGDPQSSKAVQDRLANAGQEQVVSKQEEPVAVRELGTQAAPRVVLPAPVAPAPPGAAQPSEAKKIRTVTIRPDGTDVAGRPAGAPAAAAAPPRTAPPPAPRAGTAPTRSTGGPISLDPQSSEPAPAPKARVATAPPPSRTEATASTGGFVVQLSSQKSEAEALASFRSLQAKFPNELGDRQPVIRRADLGKKGVFYRTAVGPFASAHEAAQFCANYKAAGGQCVVPNE